MKNREEVATLLRDIKSLPTLPDIAMKVLDISDDPTTSAKALCELVEKDLAITAKMLRLVNSPFYGIRREISSVQQALMILGISNLRNIILSTSMMEIFDQNGATGKFSRKDLWKHSVATAVVARSIAKKVRIVDPEVAFTAGLIHDIGKVIIDKYFHAEFEEIVKSVENDERPIFEAEQEILGITHAEIGEFIAARWNLPSILQEAVGYHHDPTEAEQHPEIAALIAAADKLVREMKIGEGGGSDPIIEDEVYDLCAVSKSLCDAIRDECSDNLDEQVGVFTQP